MLCYMAKRSAHSSGFLKSQPNCKQNPGLQETNKLIKNLQHCSVKSWNERRNRKNKNVFSYAAYLPIIQFLEISAT